jgi:hypothetical protein
VATLALGAIAVAFAVTVDFPKVAIGFQSDEATYYTLAHSLARDGDFTFERRDLARVWEEFPTGPEGIFLKRGREVELRFTSAFPFLSWEEGADSRSDRLYFAKSFIYPLVAAPFVWLLGTNGFLLLHALLLTVDFAAAYAFLRTRAPPASAITYATAFIGASAVPVYVVWLTPEILNFSLVLCGLFLWCYKEVAAPLTARPERRDAGRTALASWSRFLRSPASTYAAAALIGMATFSKPTNVAAMLPILGLAFLRRSWRSLVMAGLVAALVAGGLFAMNLAITGEANYQGGDRNTFYGGTGFPFQSPSSTFQSAGLARGRNEVLTDILLSRDALLSVFPRNLIYFVFGRHTGLFPYFLPGLVSIALFLMAGRFRMPGTDGPPVAPAVGGVARPAFQWLTLATFVLASVGLLLLVPYTYSGGGGPIGNRYFLGIYPLLLFVTPALSSPCPALLALALGGLFTAQLVLNPFYVSFHPAEHAKSGPFRWLPVEKTLLNDLPVNVTPSRVRQPLGGTPPVSAYFLDDNAYPREGEWFWVKGESRAELLLRAPAVPRGDDAFESKRIRHVTVEVRSGDTGNRVIVKTDVDSSRADLPPQGSATLTLRVGNGVPYRAHPGQPTSYVYWMSITSKTGFTPIFTSGSRDSRYLGAYVRIAPVYER